MKSIRVLILALCLPTVMAACSFKGPATVVASSAPTLHSSGTIIISGSLPPRTTRSHIARSNNDTLQFAPLLGYTSSSINYYTAMNEYWLEVSRADSRLVLKRGEESVEAFGIEGGFTIDAGSYVLETKEQNPSWYAPEQYFLTRALEVPPAGSPLRFRRGALGSAALFASSGLIIHSSPLWTPEVGGIRVTSPMLQQLFEKLTPGTRINVR